MLFNLTNFTKKEMRTRIRQWWHASQMDELILSKFRLLYVIHLLQRSPCHLRCCRGLKREPDALDTSPTKHPMTNSKAATRSCLFSQKGLSFFYGAFSSDAAVAVWPAKPAPYHRVPCSMQPMSLVQSPGSLRPPPPSASRSAHGAAGSPPFQWNCH